MLLRSIARIALLVAVLAPSATLGSGATAYDGRTTYCRGVPAGQTSGSGTLDSKDATADRCPVQLELKLAAAIAVPLTPLQAGWTATVATVEAVKASRFPRLRDPATTAPRDIIATQFRACRLGSPCATPEDRIEPKTVIAAPGSGDLGPFDPSGKKASQSYEFTFPSPGEFIVGAKIVLPGDSLLNVSAIEFTIYQRVQVGKELKATTPGTVAPLPPTKTEVGAEAATTTSNINFQTDLTKSKDEIGTAESTMSNPGAAGTSSSMGKLLPWIAVAVGAVVIIGALAAIVRQRRRWKLTTENRTHLSKPRDGASAAAGIFRLSPTSGLDAANAVAPGGQNEPSAATVPTTSMRVPVPVVMIDGRTLAPSRQLPSSAGSYLAVPGPRSTDAPAAITRDSRSSTATSDLNDSEYTRSSGSSIFSLGDADDGDYAPIAGGQLQHQQRSSRRLSVIPGSSRGAKDYVRDTSESAAQFNERHSEAPSAWATSSRVTQRSLL